MNTCERCNGTGLEDSGGVQPWGEPILVECECRLMERNMDESRKQFEEWAKQKGLISESFGLRSVNEQFVNSCWDAWQASRAELVVELPEPFKLAKASSGLTYYYEDEVVAAIRAAGIKVKE